MKLTQKQFLKGSREFEIIDDTLQVCIKSPFKQEKLSLVLAILNPEPVENGRFLEFYSRVKCDPMLSLLIDKPDTVTFNAFVDELKKHIREEYGAFAGLKNASQLEGPTGNSYEEPPDFDTPAGLADRKGKHVNVDSLDTSIAMLQQHLDTSDIEPLLGVLKALKDEPQNEDRLRQLVKTFDELGPRQGAVLTYAPYLAVLLADG